MDAGIVGSGNSSPGPYGSEHKDGFVCDHGKMRAFSEARAAFVPPRRLHRKVVYLERFAQ